MHTGPSNAEIAALLHIDLPKKGPKSFWQLAQTLPECGVGKKFYRKVRLRVTWPAELHLPRWLMSPGNVQTWPVEEGCHWEVTRVKQKVNNGNYPDESVHGKAWGKFTWKGTVSWLAWAVWARRHLTRCATLLLLQGRRTVGNTRSEAPIRRCGSI